MTNLPPELQVYADEFDKLIDPFIAKVSEKNVCGDEDGQSG